MCCSKCKKEEDIYRERSKKEGLIFYKYNCVYYEKKAFERLQEKGKIPKDAEFKVLE